MLLPGPTALPQSIAHGAHVTDTPPPPCALSVSQTEAAAYATALAAAADAEGMERAPSGAPRFDLLLLGVGADGHVGSLYPGGAATLADPASAPWVQPVVKAKPPPSITLSLAVMNAAKSVLVRGGAWGRGARGGKALLLGLNAEAWHRLLGLARRRVHLGAAHACHAAWEARAVRSMGAEASRQQQLTPEG